MSISRQRFVGVVAGTTAAAVWMLALAAGAIAQTNAPTNAPAGTMTVKVDQPGAKISPMLYGLMTEEINHSYDGGLYAELIQNRVFQDPPPRRGRGRRGRRGRRGGGNAARGVGRGGDAAQQTPNPNTIQHWSVVASDGSDGEIAIDTNDPVNTIALTRSMRLDVAAVGDGGRVGVANDGFWGIPVRPDTTYRASFYARGSAGFAGPLTVAIESNDGATIYATGSVPTISTDWKKYELQLSTESDAPTTADTRFVISAGGTGSVWFSLVSLFPPTYKDRANGNRADIMQLLADMKPAFLRFPGGNYLEGRTFADRFNWKAMIGPLEDRPGHNSPWNYRSSDGMGLLEFLNWCEDLGVEPVVGIFAGYTLNRESVVGEELEPYVQDALDEIEYITGDTTTKWGALRAKHGHPDPFPLTYVEIGNEDHLGSGPETYDQRFTQFYDAIKAKYPDIQIISSMVSSRDYPMTRQPDVIDDHYYQNAVQLAETGKIYDAPEFRNGPKIFVGEYASREGDPTPTLNAALGDAAFLTSLERNSDVIIMSCYAPLFTNVNPGGQQWSTDLIGFDTLSSYGSPSYYAQLMFCHNRGDVVLPVELSGSTNDLFTTASRDEAAGDVIIKFVNGRAGPLSLEIKLQGVNTTQGGFAEVLTGGLNDVNSIEEPTKISPKRTDLAVAAGTFKHEFPGYSVSVLRIKTR